MANNKTNKHITTNSSSHKVAKLINRKYTTFITVKKTEPSALRKAQRLRDIMVAMLEKKFSIDVIKETLKTVDVSSSKNTAEFISSLTDEVTPVTPTTEVPATSADSQPEVAETLSEVPSTEFDQSLQLNTLNPDMVARFLEYYEGVAVEDIPKDVTDTLESLKQTNNEIQKINSSLDVISSSIEKSLPSLELSFYQNQCKIKTQKIAKLERKLEKFK